jgi:catechol 2,3-dioxygenase-like lactoylglutathione lyase family enzyme
MNFSVEHVGLAARDTAALKDWYVRVFNARLVFQNDESPSAFFLELPGGLLIEIYPAASSLAGTGDNRLAGWRHLALRVDSIETSRLELAGRGVEFPDPVKPAGGGGRVLFFSDPEGNLLHLIERPADSIFRR